MAQEKFRTGNLQIYMSVGAGCEAMGSHLESELFLKNVSRNAPHSMVHVISVFLGLAVDI